MFRLLGRRLFGVHHKVCDGGRLVYAFNGLVGEPIEDSLLQPLV